MVCGMGDRSTHEQREIILGTSGMLKNKSWEPRSLHRLRAVHTAVVFALCGLVCFPAHVYLFDFCETVEVHVLSCMHAYGASE